MRSNENPKGDTTVNMVDISTDECPNTEFVRMSESVVVVFQKDDEQACTSIVLSLEQVEALQRAMQ